MLSKPFIHDNFLLGSASAERLYHEYAHAEPILDYHNHLPPADIANNRSFKNLHEIWLEGDHYKWRALRANGVDESLITGSAPPYEKFLAWAKTVPNTLRNPLYHWTHLELQRYFGIFDLLSESTAKAIWDQTTEALAQPELSTHGILNKFNVVALCTTDDPADPLTHHHDIAKSGLKTKVFPAFRPDKALAINTPKAFIAWVTALSIQTEVVIDDLDSLKAALRKTHDQFHDAGSRLSDHGLPHCYANFPTESEAKAIFTRALTGHVPSPEDHAKFASHMMVFFAQLDAEKGWTKQLHLGAIRATNTRALATIGPDTGFDSIGDYSQAAAMAGYLDRLEQDGILPKLVIYNNNPADNYVFSTMIGNFQDGKVAGKIQFGSGWWYLDAKDGIEWQLNALSNNGLLSRFIGMLTDSRSFMSYPRHEYFRRVLCNLLGAEMDRGEIPLDFELVGSMVRNICFENARQYLNLPLENRA